ncbi:9f2f734f-2f2d-45cf-879c-eb5c28848c13 [Sclerotinia trifoliorum]|uniref:9f2f734f-2f2d-45cf-879c-eb5c28848c13 n=1 Tax=Sclerotinia trifoliorum TaxID=28548 RepID=A0A8H2W1J3_9HELO|nr:9f2f734f-2f2d-45cf-879c-eb5c28848c13 [Sclerotinia trifoliorum]
MNEEELARVLRRDPNINVPRPVYKRPEVTQPLKWTKFGKHFLASKFPAQPRTQPRQWLTQEQLKTPWRELPHRRLLNINPPPLPPPPPARSPPPPAPPETGDNEEGLLPLEEELEQGETPEARKRDRSTDEEDDDDHESIPVKKQKIDSEIGRKINKGKGIEKSQAPKAIRPPAHAPGILPLSPQDARAPKIANPEIGPLRSRFPGPGNFEYRWKNNPKADEDREIRDGIPDSFQDVPDVRLMPERISKNRRRVKDFKYMGDQEFYDMEIPDSGDCFFGAVSMALYGTAMYWHWVKFCHLHFFRFVLTHPGHPRYDFYWRLNSNKSSQTKKNIWQQLSTPHAWQSSDLLNVTADIFNLFIVLYEQLDIPKDIPKSQQKPQDHQSIGLYGQYSATHIFLHIINRNHYQTLVPYKNPEAQFPFPDGVTIDPKPGRAKERPPGGRGKAIIPPPIAQPVYVGPWDLDIARVLGINTKDGALDIDLMNTWMRRERQAAERKNDPTEVKWWIQAKEREAKEERAREARAVQGLSKEAEVKKAQPSNEALAKNLDETLGKGNQKNVQSLNEELEKDLERTLRKWKGKDAKLSYEDFTKDLKKKLGNWKGKGVQLSYDHFLKVLERTLDKEKSLRPSSEELAKGLEDILGKWKKKGVQFSYEDFANGLRETLNKGQGVQPSNENLSKDLGKTFDQKKTHSWEPEPRAPRTPTTRNPSRKKRESSLIDLLSSSDEEPEEIKHEMPLRTAVKPAVNPDVKSSTKAVSSKILRDTVRRGETPVTNLPSSSDEEVEEVKEVKYGRDLKAPVKSSTSGVPSKNSQSKAVDDLSSSDEDVVEVRQEDTPGAVRRPSARPAPATLAPAAGRGGRPPPRW